MDKQPINVKITLSIKKNKTYNEPIYKTIITSLYKNKTLDKQFFDLLISKEREIGYINRYQIKFYYYLLKGKGEKEIEGKYTISKLNIKDNDNILITNYKNEILKINEDILSSRSSNSKENLQINKQGSAFHNLNNNLEKLYVKDISENNRKNHSCKKIIKILIIIFILLLILLGIILYIILNHKIPITPVVDYKEEDLIIYKNYTPNLLMRYQSRKEVFLKTQGDSIQNNVSERDLSQISDFFFLIREGQIEKDNIHSIQKKYYTGYIAFLNITLRNSTKDMVTVYDKFLNNYFKVKNIPDLQYIGEQGNLCFVKLEFYQNGEIKNYFIPNKFSTDDFSYIENIAQLILTKISSNLYVDSINDSLNEIKNNNNLNRRRNLSSKRYNIKKFKIFQNIPETLKKRELNIDNINETDSPDSINDITNSSLIFYPDEIEAEEYLTISKAESFNQDLRQIKKCPKNLNDSNNDNNYSNLTQFSMRNVENDEVNMEGSEENTTIYTLINDEGILEYVEDISITKFISPKNDNYDQDFSDEKYKDIYNDDNQISYLDVTQNENNNFQSKNNISFNISNVTILNSHIINCSNYFINESFNKILFNYFDNFTYKLYKKEEDQNNSFLDKEDNKRYLQENNEYYGMKKINYVKPIYKYNLIGLKMAKEISTEINPSTGITDTYFVSIFGNKNLKIKMDSQYTNMHIITKNKNQMGYNLLLLLQQTNDNLIKRTMKSLDNIINIEINLTESFKNVYDFSNLFKDSLNDMYDQVTNLGGNIFNELIKLIDEVYDNYTELLNKTKMRKYNEINIIKNITKEEYLNYIYKMLNILENFYNKTLIFLENITEELKNINDFQIDILYDIIDNLYESKLIFKYFIQNLFKSIEKGIIKFKYELNEFIEELIGDLLYITDFLAININKNEILVNSIDEGIRNEVKLKLKNFRNIILEIIEIIINDINQDYQREMNNNNNQSIYSYSNQKTLEYLDLIENKSNRVINTIKKGINNIELYELYSENINVINNINNKTIIEFVNNIYNEIITKITNLKPDYIDKNKEINQNERKLFNISKKIINEANSEIKDINNYIKNFSKNFAQEYLYSIHYDLYYFRHFFIKYGVEELSNQINSLVENSINISLKGIIEYNYEQVMTEFREINSFFDRCKESKKKLGKRVPDRYGEYLGKLQQINNQLIYSNQIYELLNKYIKKLKNGPIENIKEKILSINKFYFNQELYKNNFYFFEQIDDEIIKLIVYYNNYFNELFDGNLITKAIKLIDQIIKPYQEKKHNEFTNFYEYIYGRTSKGNIENEDDEDFYCYWGVGVTYEYTDSATQRINYLINDLRRVDSYLNNNFQIVLSKFNNKYENYINDYINKYNMLFTHLFGYMNNKIGKNENIHTLIKEYESTFNYIIIKFSNNKLADSIINELNTIFMNSFSDLNDFNNNINLIKDQYYEYYYIKNFSNFLEYPEEIIYKINQFLNELINISIIIKNTTNLNIQKKINNIINTTNIYITTFLKNHFDYIISNLNSNSIINEYNMALFQGLNQTYNNCFNYIKKSIDNFDYKDIILVSLQEYEKQMEDTINNTKEFILFLEEIINQNFTSQNCEESIPEGNSDMDYNNTFKCKIVKKQFDEKYSKYNFNIIKLREGIFYSKTLLENIDNLYNSLNFNNLVNIDSIICKDEYLNDKNIIQIYNNSNYKLKDINKESLDLIDEYLQQFIQDFQVKYSYKNEYINLLKQFENIIKLENIDYNTKIRFYYENLSEYILMQLNKFNETLLKQLSMKDNYDAYNFNETYFKEMELNYYFLIKNLFKNNKNRILNLNTSYKFHNSFISNFRKLQEEKRGYFKKKVNEYAKNFDFYMLNMTYDLGENLKNFMEKEYSDFEFETAYDYVELFENYSDNYISKFISELNNTEQISLKTIENIFDTFYSKFKKNSSNYISNDSIKELEYNKSKCLNYSFDILYKEKNKNEISKEKYNYYIQIINKIFIECSNIENNEIDKYDIHYKIEYIGNNNRECYYNLSQKDNNTDYNESLIILNCYMNNFYNYTGFYFNNFSDNYKDELDEIINSINIKLKDNYIYEIYLNTYLDKNFELESYEDLNLLDISYDFDGIEGIINYINYLKNETYKVNLYDLLIQSFNSSYFNLINNYLEDDIIENITILINNRFELYIEYITLKIIDEYNYYLLILNNTVEMGLSSKNSFIKLYENINKKLNNTFYYLIEEDIEFSLEIFKKDYKKTIRNIFIDYYYYNLNIYDLTIYNLKDIYDEIILDNKFNKTIDIIAEEIINAHIISKIKLLFKESLIYKFQYLFNQTLLFKNEIFQILERKKTKDLPEDMNKINAIITNYSIIVNNQNNHYYLNISDSPFNQLSFFINNYLEPPLALIKNNYNNIEQKLLDKINNITNNFPDYYFIIKNELKLENLYEPFLDYFDVVKNEFLEYEDILTKDFDTYLNKIIHFVFIDGLYSFNKPCKYSFCKIDFNSSEKNERRRVENKEQNRNINIIDLKFNKTKIDSLKNKKIRKLNGYDSTMGAITENDILDFLLQINDTIKSFSENYLGKGLKSLNTTVNTFIKKINDTYLNHLKRSIHMVIIKFSTILTLDNYNRLEEILYYKYNNISLYINEYSRIISFYKNEFNDLLNTSSFFIGFSSNASFYKIKGYYNILCSLIQNKMKYLSKEELKKYKRFLKKKESTDDNEDDDDDDPNTIEEFREEIFEIEEVFKNVHNKFIYYKSENLEIYGNVVKKEIVDGKITLIVIEANKEGELKKYTYHASKLEKFKTEFEEELSVSLNIKKGKLSISPLKMCYILFKYSHTFAYNIKLASFLDLVIAIVPSFDIKACIDIGIAYNWKKKEGNIFIDASGEASCSLTLDLGLYVPSNKSIISISVNIGIHGIIGAGKVGIKLEFGFDKIIIDIYSEIKAFEFTFYIMFTFTISIPKIYSFSFKIYLINEALGQPIKHEYHYKKEITYVSKQKS